MEDFGRSQYFNPCTNEDPCDGDFICDGNVDGGDVEKFMEDFARSQYFNPCPAVRWGTGVCEQIESNQWILIRRQSLFTIKFARYILHCCCLLDGKSIKKLVEQPKGFFPSFFSLKSMVRRMGCLCTPFSFGPS